MIEIVLTKKQQKSFTSGLILFRCYACGRLLLFAGFAFKLDHHDGDIVRATTVEGLEDDALGAEVRLVQSFPDEANRLLVAEGVPQAVRRQDHELRLQLVQVKGHDVGIGNDHVEVFQRVISQRTGHGQDALDTPRAIETNETACGGSRGGDRVGSGKTVDNNRGGSGMRKNVKNEHKIKKNKK